jgi:hypothetical protein
MAVAVAEEEIDGVGAIGHVDRGEEAGLPDVFAGQEFQGFDEAEGEDGDDGGDEFVGSDAEDGIARADEARAEEGAGCGEKGGVGGDEFVLAGEADNLFDRRAVFAVALDLFEQGVDAGFGPGAGELRMGGFAGREGDVERGGTGAEIGARGLFVAADPGGFGAGVGLLLERVDVGEIGVGGEGEAGAWRGRRSA